MENPTDFERAAKSLVERGTCVTALRVLIDAILDPKLGRERVKVLAVILRHINNESGKAWPSRSMIAREIGVSEKTVSNALTDLRVRGTIFTAGREMTLVGSSHPSRNLLPETRHNGKSVPAPTGEKVPATRVRDSEPTKGTESVSGSDGSLFGAESELPIGVHQTAKGFVVVGVNKLGQSAGKRFETAISKTVIGKCAKLHKLTPDEANETARIVLEGWSSDGFAGFGKGMQPADNFVMAFGKSLAAFANGSAAMPSPSTRPAKSEASQFTDAEGWDYRDGPHPCGYPPGARIEAALRKAGHKC